MVLKRCMVVAVMVAVMVCIGFSQVSASGNGHTKAEKKGILLVAFGTSIPKAQVAFDNIDKAVKLAFTNVPVRWAYTSHIIRKKLAKQGTHLDSTAVALAKMMDEGFTHVAVQSLHTIRGEEFQDMVHIAKAFERMTGGIQKITIGSPLLSLQKDIEKVSDAIFSTIPKERSKKDAVVLMGHGSPHPANAFYSALMFNLQQKDPNIFVGTVEGAPEIDVISSMLKSNKITKAYLMPFMSVAGDHAMNDMAGDEDDSWKSVLTKQGVSCKSILKGTAESDVFVAIWVDHLKVAMTHL